MGPCLAPVAEQTPQLAGQFGGQMMPEGGSGLSFPAHAQPQPVLTGYIDTPCPRNTEGPLGLGPQASGLAQPADCARHLLGW